MYVPQFTISNKILRNIGIIEASKEVIDHAPLLPYYEKEFRKDALVRSVHHGTHIEGNELTLNQAEKVIEGADVIGRDRDVQEILNYRKVMDYIGELKVLASQRSGQSEKFKVDEEFIKKLHKLTVEKLLEEGKAGEFRKTQVVVKNNRTAEVSFRPPKPEYVSFQIADFLAYIESPNAKEIHPVLRSGIVHYEFVRIHPFVDGNGRVGRALSTFFLYQEGYDIRKFFSLEEYFDTHAENYYLALQSVEKENGDLTSWLEYFTEGLAIELNKIKEKVEHISIDSKIREKLGGKPLLLTERQLAIIEYIQKTGYLQNQVFKTLFPMVSEDTILNELKPLIENGIIKKKGVTKGAKYVMG